MVVDEDNDGISGEVEALGPHNGDGNQDGIPDRIQSNVASFPNAQNGQYVVLSVAADTRLEEVHAALFDPSAQMPLDGGFNLPIGLIVYRLAGFPGEEAVQVTLILPEGIDYISCIQYGMTPDKTEDHWYEFTFNGLTGFLMDGNVMAIQYVDGERGDGDLKANGVIESLGGPAVAGPSAVEGWDLYQ